MKTQQQQQSKAVSKNKPLRDDTGQKRKQSEASDTPESNEEVKTLRRKVAQLETTLSAATQQQPPQYGY